MIRYIKNILLAFAGCNPFRMELERIKTRYNDLQNQVLALQKLCDVCKEKQQLYEQYVSDYIILVENLRQHLSEKDRYVRDVEKYYNTKLKERDEEINGLRSERPDK